MEKQKNIKIISPFLKKYPLVFKKYQVIKKIANGAFSEIYSGINIINKEKVALKIEKRNAINKYLESECYTLFTLRDIGIPKVLSFGHNQEYDILIMPLLGKSLLDIFISKKLNYEFKDICIIAIQIIERIHWVHSRKIIHRDIKPDNFLIGLNDPHLLYIIDFGLSKKYQSTKTGKHIKICELKKFIGSIIFASYNALRLIEQSRRDDLESIGYMLVYFMKGCLPWQRIKVYNKKECYLKVAQLKKGITPEKLCSNLPKEFSDYLRYVKNLKFEEDPNYGYLKNLFVQMMSKQGFEVSTCFFSWVNLNNINLRYIKRQINLSKRSCSRKRVINKLRKTLENSSKSCSANKNENRLNESYNLTKNNIGNNYKKINMNKNIKNNIFQKMVNPKKINIYTDPNLIGKLNKKGSNPEIVCNSNLNDEIKIALNNTSNSNILNLNKSIPISPLAYTIKDHKKNQNNFQNEKIIKICNNNQNISNFMSLKNSQILRKNISNNNIIRINPYKNKANIILNNNYHKRFSSINVNKDNNIYINDRTLNNNRSTNNYNSLNYKKKNIIIINNNIYPNNILSYNNTLENNHQKCNIKQVIHEKSNNNIRNNIHNNIRNINNINKINIIKAQREVKRSERNKKRFKFFNLFSPNKKKQSITFQNNKNWKNNINNNQLMKEIDKFNKRYDNEYILGNENINKKIKISKINHLIRSPDYKRSFGSKINISKYKSPNNNNCTLI